MTDDLDLADDINEISAKLERHELEGITTPANAKLARRNLELLRSPDTTDEEVDEAIELTRASIMLRKMKLMERYDNSH